MTREELQQVAMEYCGEDTRLQSAFMFGAEYGCQYVVEKTCEWLSMQKELVGISFEKDFYERYKQFMKDGKL